MAKKQKKSAMARTRRYAGRVVAAIPVVVPGVVAAVASVATARELQRQGERSNGSTMTASDDYTPSSNGRRSSSNGRTRASSSSKTKMNGQKAAANA